MLIIIFVAGEQRKLNTSLTRIFWGKINGLPDVLRFLHFSAAWFLHCIHLHRCPTLNSSFVFYAFLSVFAPRGSVSSIRGYLL